jgi:hypothetical protein
MPICPRKTFCLSSSRSQGDDNDIPSAEQVNTAMGKRTCLAEIDGKRLTWSILINPATPG